MTPAYTPTCTIPNSDRTHLQQQLRQNERGKSHRIRRIKGSKADIKLSHQLLMSGLTSLPEGFQRIIFDQRLDVTDLQLHRSKRNQAAKIAAAIGMFASIVAAKAFQLMNTIPQKHMIFLSAIAAVVACLTGVSIRERLAKYWQIELFV